jgi:hypothetical protein
MSSLKLEASVNVARLNLHEVLVQNIKECIKQGYDDEFMQE